MNKMSQNQSIWSDNIRKGILHKYNLKMPWPIKLFVLVATPFWNTLNETCSNQQRVPHIVYRQILQCEKVSPRKWYREIHNFAKFRFANKFSTWKIFAHWPEESQRFIHNLVTKVNCSDKPNPLDVANAIEAMRELVLSNNVKVNAMPRLASCLDGLPWNEIQTMVFFWTIFGILEFKFRCNTSHFVRNDRYLDPSVIMSGESIVCTLQIKIVSASAIKMSNICWSLYSHHRRLEEISGLEIKILLRTGATCSVINSNTFQATSDVG